MGGMSPSFDSAMDLSALAPKKAEPGASYVVEADDQTFENVLNLSVRHPVVVEFYSPRANAQQLSDDLAQLADAAGGKYLLVRVNVDAARGIAQALGIQAVPMVVGALGGQLVPLFQGTRPRQEVAAVIDELLKAALANGVVGKAQPTAPASGTAASEAEAAHDPRFDAADAAMEAGDYAGAAAEFEKILAQTPGDAEALAGKSGAELLVRAGDLDPRAVAARLQADPGDAAVQLQAADLEFMDGRPEAAFARLIEVVRAQGPGRDDARVRLLSLFEALGPTDPAVLKARRDLTSALF